jgi:hypothetical protein
LSDSVEKYAGGGGIETQFVSSRRLDQQNDGTGLENVSPRFTVQRIFCYSNAFLADTSKGSTITSRVLFTKHNDAAKDRGIGGNCLHPVERHSADSTHTISFFICAFFSSGQG